ncbi:MULTISPECIES: MucBP domain-containing protein [unclassified Listeria]|uniref:MucBP domain-containing protein n=1 Tax=unclassified Listeria TaxID=2642072 RepID=UPI000B58C6F4|nr:MULTISPECIES: MucBP domain-containing protein [unclassified Listeria]
MKKIVATILACLLATFGINPGMHVQAAATDTVNIPDQNLLEGLKDLLDKPFATSLTEADLAQLDNAAINYSNPAQAAVPGRVSDLTGLEFATNMTQLDISASDVSDITPIINLPKLKRIVGVNTALTSLEGIQNLPSLEQLELGGDYIQDFSPLLGAKNLTSFSYESYRWLSSDYSAIDDISILAEMPNLQILNLNDNEVSDLSPLSGNSSIQTLILNKNNVQQLAPLENMNNLEVLYLNQNDLTSLDDLATLEGLEILYADSNHIVDVSSLNHLFNTMIKGSDDYKGLQINNQTITLPAITVKQGDTAVSQNPTKGLDSQVMAVQSASNEGQISSDSKTISWDNMTSDTTVTYNVAATDQSAAGVDFSYSLKVSQPIKVVDDTYSEVTVNYVDTDGNTLAPSDTLSGVVGDNYTSTAKDIDGWILQATPDNATGVFSDTAQTVTYVYEKEVIPAQDVTVKYVDGDGNDLATADTLSGNIGDNYTSTAKDIDGWILQATPDNATGLFSNTAQTVTYVYEKEVVPAQDITVKYVDSDGNDLAAADTLSGNIGDNYTSTAKDIDGWVLQTTPDNATGLFSDTAQTVTYIYEEASNDVMPTPPADDSTDNNNDTTDTDGKIPSTNIDVQEKNVIKDPTSNNPEKVKTSLPKTGDSAVDSGILVGLGALLLGALAAFTRRQRKTK